MPGTTIKRASYKRIILCCDGTWLESDMGDKSVPSNVAKMARAIATTGIDEQGDSVEQIVSYHPGLGTGALPFQKAIYGGLGWGLDHDVCQIYDFISNNYEEGDELFFFGFSRGAFTVRSVASLVCDIGVMTSVNMTHFAEMWKAYRANTGEGVGEFRETKWYRDHAEKLGFMDVKVKVIGVWDTVGALGIPRWPLVDWLTSFGIPINKQYAFHNTNLSERVEYAFQALAIDEKRLTFSPTLWHKKTRAPAIKLEQCWFPGVHGNIGGQAEDPRSAGDHEEIGDNTFAWMVDNLHGKLTFDEGAISVLIEQHKKALGVGWGCGPIVDNFSGLQGAFFRLLGTTNRTPGNYPRDPGDGTDGATDETLHPLVRIRSSKVRQWNPIPTKGYVLEEPDGKTGWKWKKPGSQAKALKEYVMERDKTMSLAYKDKDGKTTKFKTAESLSRTLCPPNILADLDRDNAMRRDSFWSE